MKTTDNAKVIGTITVCINNGEFLYLARHCLVKVIAVFKGAAAANYDPEMDCPIATTDEELASLGGLDANDRVEVQPWIEERGRFSFASSDPRAIDLEAFASLLGA